MHNLGQLEKFIAYDGNKQKQCIRLKTKSVDNFTPEISTNKAIKQHNFAYRDIPMEYHFYQDIVNAKEKGLVRQVERELSWLSELAH